MFSTVVALIYIPTGSVHKGSLFSTPLPICYCVLFDDSHFDRCEVILHSGFDLHSLDG